jgi:hypothetical protein
MSYITLKQAAEATGLNEVTIRRLCKKPESKPHINLKKAKNGFMYTIHTNYLFDIYPPIKQDSEPVYTKDDIDYSSVDIEPVQAYTALLSAKDEIIELLKSETAYLRAENTSIREENRELKMLSESRIEKDTDNTNIQEVKKSLWKRIFG